MTERAGFEIGVDLVKLRKEMQDATQLFRQFNKDAVNAATGIRTLEESSNRAGKAMDGLGSSAHRALDIGLGMLGVQSIESVVYKIKDLVRESFNLALNLQAIESQARAVFGTAFPKMTQEAERLAQKFRRSGSDMLQYMAGFGDFLDQLGVGPEATQKMSTALTELTVEYGKLKVNLSDQQIFDALQAGIGGTYRRLKDLDVLIKDDTLQQYANSTAIKNKVKDMDAEQKATLITAFLLDDVRKKQDEIAKATGTAGDAAKTAGAAWKDLEEAMGKAVSPIAAAVFRTIANALTMMSDAAKHATSSIQMFMLTVAKKGIAGAVFDGVWAAIRGPGPSQNTTPLGPDLPSWMDGDMLGILNRTPQKAGGGGGGGRENKEQKKALEDARTILQAMEKAQKEIVDGGNEEAKGRLAVLKARKDELETWVKLGIASEKERQELEKINKTLGRNPNGAGDLLGKIEGQLDEQKKKIEEATRVWEEQAKKIEDVKGKIKDLNDRIADERKQLAQTLLDIDKDLARKREDIDREAGRSREEKVADLLREKEKLNAKLVNREGLSPEEQKRLGELESSLKSVDPSLLQSGKEIAGLSDLQLIDRDMGQKKQDAETDAARRKQDATDRTNQRVAEIQADIDAENVKLAELQKVEAEAKKAVIDALSEREIFARDSFKRVEEFTRKHVDSQIEQFSRLKAAIQSLKAVNADVAGLETSAVSTALGFKGGGYTGGVSPHEVAGVVHGQEFVFDAEATRNIGVGKLQSLQTMAHTFAEPKIHVVEKDASQHITFPLMPTGDPYRDMKRAEFLALGLSPRFR